MHLPVVFCGGRILDIRWRERSYSVEMVKVGQRSQIDIGWSRAFERSREGLARVVVVVAL